MQKFYTQLDTASGNHTTYLKWLVRLNKESRTNVASSRHNVGWGTWGRI